VAPHLQFLGDVFATPRWLPGRDVFSVGDVAIVLRFALLVGLTVSRADSTGTPAAPTVGEWATIAA
jgi:hypothetical protein